MIKLNPRDMKAQLAGTDAAVVTFHLGSEENPARRSLVLRRTAGKWKVIHWHASRIGTAPGRPILNLRSSIFNEFMASPPGIDAMQTAIDRWIAA